MTGTGPLELRGKHESSESEVEHLDADQMLELGRKLIQQTPVVRELNQHRIFEEMREKGLPEPYDAPTRPAKNGTFVWDENKEQFVIKREGISDVEA